MTNPLLRSSHMLCFLFLFGLGFCAPQAQARLDDARVVWGRAQLDAALSAARYAPGMVTVETTIDPVSPRLPPSARKAEGFYIGTSPGRIEIVGADAAGVLYGCLEAAAKINDQRTLPMGLHIVDQPTMTQRATCILLMKLGSYNYAVSPQEFPFFYDRTLWTNWLDQMARLRFNSMAIWNGHPFAYFVRFDRYQEAQEGMEPGLVERNQAMLHWLVEECSRRNIRILFQFYNIHTSVFFQRAHQLPEENRVPTPLLRDYTNYAVERFVREFPEIGLYITPGEALDIDHTDTWVNDVLYPAVQRGGLRAPVWLRSWGIDLPHAQKVAAQHPDLWFERKYNVEMIARDQVDPANRDWAALTGNHVVNIHMASDVDPFRWWPPSYIRRCVQSALGSGANGLHLYPRRSWRWPQGGEPGSATLQPDRDRMWFATWARYAWNPSRSDSDETAYWIERLAVDFGNREAAAQLLAAQESLADVLPSIQRLVWLGFDNHTIVSAGIRLGQLEKAEGIPDQPLPDVAQRIPAFLASLRAGAEPPVPTPMDFLQSRVKMAQQAVALARRGADNATLRRDEAMALVRDAEATLLVVRFYAEKMQAAMLHAQASALAPKVRKDAFLVPLERSLNTFRELAGLTRGHYDSITDVPATNPVRLKKVPYHWTDLVPLYEREFDFYRKSLTTSAPRLATTPAHAGLAGLLHGDAGLRSPKAVDPIATLDLAWSGDDSTRGHDWSAEWRGLLIWPRDGQITLQVRAEDPTTLRLGGREMLGEIGYKGEKTFTWSARQGEAVPLELTYDHPRRSGGGHLEIRWHLNGSTFSPVPAEALRHSDRDAGWSDEAVLLGRL